MSQSRLFTVIGDANVGRNMTGLNMASREAMKGSQLISCDTLALLDGALSQIRPESSVCIVAAITDMLIGADSVGTVYSSIESVLNTFKAKISSVCHTRKNLQVVIAPPLYRNRPFWYQKNLPQISGLFSAVLSNDVPQNLYLMPSFCSQDLMPDGVALTPVSGLHYMLHLFDQTDALLQVSSASDDVKIYRVQEVCRQHDDRIVYLEQRHGTLDGRFDVKAASDAEFNDWVLNRSEEDWLTILGAKRLPEMTPREWQQAAKKMVNDIFKQVCSLNNTRVDYCVVYVANPLRFRKTGQTVYNVRLNSVDASRRLRDLYSGFFRGNAPVKLPTSFKGVSIRNKVTLETRVRIKILNQLGLNFQESNGPGSSYKVKGFESRPLLSTFPPSGANARPRTFTFIEAVTQLPAVISDEGLMLIHQVVGTRHPGQLQTIFVVLRDDDRARIEQLIRDKPRDQPSRSVRFSSNPGPNLSTSGSFSGFGSGMDAQASLAALLLTPPPPPPPKLPSQISVPASSVRSSELRDRDLSPRHQDSRGQKHRRASSSSSDSDRRNSSKRSSKRSSRRSSKRSSKKTKKHSSKRSRRTRSPSSSSSDSSGSSGSSSTANSSHVESPATRDRER